MEAVDHQIGSGKVFEGQGQSRVLSHFPSGGVRRHESLMQT
jgi:hypothetical protein